MGNSSPARDLELFEREYSAMSDPAAVMQSMFLILREVIGKLTAPGTGKEYGVTIDDIVADLTLLYGIRAAENGQHEFQQHIMAILSTPAPNGMLLFESHQRADGIIVYKNVEYPQIYYDYPAFQMDPIQIRDVDQPIPDNIEDLTQEIARLKDQIDAAEKKREHLANCYRLLQQPARLAEEKKRLEETVIWMKDMQSMVDDKMRKVLDFLNSEFP